MKRRVGTKAIARLGLLATVAVALGYVEYLLPLTAIPGIKLGLSNAVLLYALFLMDAASAAILMILKVGLSGLLFGGASAMLYSLAGGVMSLTAMLLFRRIKGLGAVGVSVAGAFFHNAGQMALACFMVESRAILAYAPVLIVSAAVTGTLTGLAAEGCMRALKKHRRRAAEEPAQGIQSDGKEP